MRSDSYTLVSVKNVVYFNKNISLVSTTTHATAARMLVLIRCDVFRSLKFFSF